MRPKKEAQIHEGRPKFTKHEERPKPRFSDILPVQISQLAEPISPNCTVRSSCHFDVCCMWMLAVPKSNCRIIQPVKHQLWRSKWTQLSAAYFPILSSSFILNVPLTPIFSTISPHYICCFLPTLLVLDFFYLTKWLISTLHHVTYHFFISHSHSTSLSFLSLFLSLSSSSSPFSYK